MAPRGGTAPTLRRSQEPFDRIEPEGLAVTHRTAWTSGVRYLDGLGPANREALAWGVVDRTIADITDFGIGANTMRANTRLFTVVMVRSWQTYNASFFRCEKVSLGCYFTPTANCTVQQRPNTRLQLFQGGSVVRFR